MKNKYWYILWGCLFIICALLGFIPQPEGFLKAVMILASVAFFVPGWVLLYRAHRHKEMVHARAVRAVSLVSLGFTLIFLILNLLSGQASEGTGNALYGFLVIFSAPMVCSQYWVASLFLWSCLLMTAFSILRKNKKQ